MTYFTQDYIDFFNELEQNNSKDWFDENRKRYENHVRKPMIALVTDVISAMQEHDLDFNSDPKKCVGRINRDIRFSKDKTPYNTHFFAHISKGSKENPLPGIAFRFSGTDSGIMSGFYKPTKEQLEGIRWNIESNFTEFQKLKTNKAFIDKFEEVKGEAYKRVPPNLKAIFEKEPLITNKQFYYVNVKSADFVLSPNLKETIIEHWLAAKPLNDFLTKV